MLFDLDCRPVNSTVMRLLPINLNGVLLISFFLCSATSGLGQEPRKFDEIPAYFPWSDVMARLDNVAINLQRESPDIVLYLIAYGGPRSCVGYADRVSLRAKTYLVAKRGVLSQRVILMDGGYLAKPTIDVWMLPSDVSPPPAMPNIDRSLLRVKNCGQRASVGRRRGITNRWTRAAGACFAS